MLSLFKNKEQPIGQNEALIHARRLLESSLNKGLIPTWDYFFHELPVFSEVHSLEEIKNYFQQLTSWPFLEEILKQEATEFYFHGPHNSQLLTLDGNKKDVAISLNEHDWQLWLEIISIHFKQNWNVEQPFASFYGELFGKKYRLSLVHASTSPEGISKLILRSLAQTPYPISAFGETKLFESFVNNKNNILIAGSTGSGKTSLLTSLISLIPHEEHVVILEDTFEIMSGHPHETRFLSGSTPQTSLKSYLSYSLRLSPDRIILGEMRSHEVIPFLMAMNTGHKGLMGTLHASNAYDALHRVALLFSLYSGEAHLSFEKVMELLCRNLEYVVFMENKKVKEVIKILGSERGIAFYESEIL